MKPFKSKFRWLTAVWLAAAMLWAVALAAAPTDQLAKTNLHHSVFILPANAEEGRDPFFPRSSRPYETAAAATTNSVEVTALVLKGFSGTPDHRLVIINNHTFAAGDEGDVIAEQGRIHVHCIEIKSRSVVIEVSGKYHELTSTDNP
jgi:hypothetical protein